MRRISAARTRAYFCLGVPDEPTSAPGLGSPRPHLRRDWARRCTEMGLAPHATSAPGLGFARAQLHRDRAHPAHILTGTGPTPLHICTGTGRTPPTSAPGLGPPLSTSAPGLGSPHATAAPGLGRAGCCWCSTTFMASWFTPYGPLQRKSHNVRRLCCRRACALQATSEPRSLTAPAKPAATSGSCADGEAHYTNHVPYQSMRQVRAIIMAMSSRALGRRPIGWAIDDRALSGPSAWMTRSCWAS